MQKLHSLSPFLLTLSSLIGDGLRFMGLGVRPRLAMTAENHPLMEDYPNIRSIYDHQQGGRMADYIKRHGLTKEFLAEDAAGKR